MQTLRNKKGFICDMDGVIYHGNRLLPGVREFVDWLQREKKDFLFLTNNSGKTQRELQAKLSRMGLDIDEKHFLELSIFVQCLNPQNYAASANGCSRCLL